MERESAVGVAGNFLTGVLLTLGSLAVLLGFIAFQWITIVGFGMTGLQLAIEASSPTSLVNYGNGLRQLTWLLLLLGTGFLNLLCGLSLIRKPRSKATITRWFIFLLSIVSFYPIYLLFAAVSQSGLSATPIIGVGFWITLIGNIVVFIVVIASR